MFDPNKKMDIVVVGGSLAGLMTSIPLLRLGHKVTILERSPTPLLHNQGAGIVAGGETQAFYRRHDRSSRRGNIGVTSPTRLYLDVKGNVIDREEYEQKMTSWDLLYYLARAAFDGVESEYLEEGEKVTRRSGEVEGKYEYGCLVKEVKEMGEKVEIHYEDVRANERRSGSPPSGEEESERTLSPMRTISADFLIVADGPSSSLRKVLVPDAPSRSYAGYIAFRGTVPELELSSSASEVFRERFAFFHGPHTQILSYFIPGPAGAMENGKRLVNWVWYWNYEQNSEEYKELMTDVDGKTHRFTLPTGGKMQKSVREGINQRARDVLAPQFAELVEKTEMPFVQAITDLPPAGKATNLLRGKAMIVGDALSGFRPHTAASTGQAALHALLVEQVFSEKMGWGKYEEIVMEHARGWQDRGLKLGNRSQFGVHPMASGSKR